jgi:ATP-dependent DNA helicase DinG
MSDTKLRPLDRERILAMVRPGGAMSQCIEGFTLREAQVEMLSEVIEAYNRSSIALIEAGTGTGKSLAYLLPAICWAAANKERSVISTATINLQEQLLQKDIPLILKALGLDMQAVLVKGMGNYLCIKRMQEATQELKFAFMQDQRELNQLADWSERANEGSRSELPFMPSTHVWQQVRAESDS